MKFMRTFSLFSLLTTVLFLSFLYRSFQNEYQVLFEKEIRELRSSLENSNVSLSSELSALKMDIDTVSLLPIIVSILETAPEYKDQELRYNAGRVFSAFAKSKVNFDQLRLLDDVGMEIVRVDFKNGSAEITPQSKLQNKADRYYFTETMALPVDQIFLSPIDLNVEHGAVQVPYKKMLRLAKKIYLPKSQRHAIIIVNYLTDHLIARLDPLFHAHSPHSNIFLLNKDGYF